LSAPRIPPAAALAVGISVREFARRSGLDEKQVRRGIEQRRLKPLADGTLDPSLVGTGWRGSVPHRRKRADKVPETADTPQLVRGNLVELSAPAVEPLPSEACSLSAIVDGGAQEVAALLLRLGHPREAVAGYVDAWHERMRTAAVECMAEDVPPPSGHATWASHPLFTAPWLEGTSWAELEGLAADAPDR
jgi:hypothetical protein